MNKREPIATDLAPAAIGPYSQAVRSGNLVFLSGQIPLDPATGNMIEGDFSARARQVFANLKAVTEAAGGDLGGIVKVNIYLCDLDRFGEVNEVMTEFFDAPFPARAAIGVAALPKGADVEVEGILAL